ncbi:EamA domain-containing membrane protein RarD [Plasticicumulans acidivorans]|uniref:EamA domain-containing membrane protein RarD n=1 Tax=Plasticicumulans acidivorans TaxID=886464 RepID=A0A317N143_9GAMM|nr:EamA domain-containing membrane protein RarD [Plasticicumulans acidivorans]
MLGSAAGFGLMPLFARVAYADGLSPSALMALRFLAASVCLGVLVRLRGESLPRGRTLAALLLMGGGLYTLIAQCYFSALTQASAALVALVLYTYPVLVMGANVLLFGEPPTWRKCAVAGLAMLGLAITVGSDLSGAWGGIGLALGSAFGYAVYILVGDRAAGDCQPLAGSFVVIAASALSCTLLALADGWRMPQSLHGWSAVLALALVSTVLAIVAFLAGLRRIGSTSTAMASTVEPVVAVLGAAVFLGEPLTVARVCGGFFILWAVILLARTPVQSTQGVVA